jgi:hypothetical protein
MTITKHCRALVLAPVLGLALLLVPAQSPTAALGVGRITVTPAKVVAGSTGTFTLVFTADDGALIGQTLLDIPRGWTPPRTAPAGSPGFVSLARGSCASATKLTRVVARRLLIATSCKRGQSFTVTYGPATASTLAADGYVFLTQTRPNAGVVKTKTIRKVVKTKTGKRKTKVRRIRVVIKPTFRPLAQKKQPVVVVTGAPIDHLAINAPSITTSGTPFGINVRAEDRYGNVACCYTGVVSFSSSDPEAFLPTPYQFTATDLGAKNFARVIVRTVGSQTITVSDNAGHADVSNAISVYPFPTG